jgi:putative PEP-CTERM system histidine kinase
MPIVADISAVVSALGACLACIQLVRPGSCSRAPVAAAFVALAVWASIAALYVHSPLSAARVHALLLALCLAPGPWLAAGLSLRGCRSSSAWKRWRSCLLSQALGSVTAAVLMQTFGVDWLTGIGPESQVVLTPLGLAAVAVGVFPSCAAFAVLAIGLADRMVTAPALLVGALGAAGSLLWVAGAVLWRGYLTPAPVVSGTQLCAVAVIVWAVGSLREVQLGQPLQPSRRLVYGAATAGLVAAYVIAARIAVTWATQLAPGALSAVRPALAFGILAGLAVIVGSRRWRHRLWVAIGHHMFRSKHDYGEVWIRLTELVAAAHTVPELLQGATALCRNVLGGPDVTVWLADSNGGLRRAMTVAGAPIDDASTDECSQLAFSEQQANEGIGRSQDAQESTLTRLTRSSLACPLRLNGRVLGVLAIDAGPSGAILDDEDRRLVRYIAAQVASALGLFRLGEEVADSREVGSFHRLSGFIIHDLKNLVAQQSMVLENAARFRTNPAFVQDALAAIEDSTGRMRSLIARLRLRATTGASTPERCDLLEVLRELVTVPHLAWRNGSRIDLATPPGVQRCLISLDRSAATQVFSNLLMNAVESLPDKLGEISVSITSATDGWRVAMQDNGSGIPATFLREQAFRPFQTTKEHGLGIGLFQCKSIIEAAGGTITVNSTPGLGTLVQVTLPALAFADSSEDTQPGDAA